jgi:hypothetical protein
MLGVHVLLCEGHEHFPVYLCGANFGVTLVQEPMRALFLKREKGHLFKREKGHRSQRPFLIGKLTCDVEQH